jgi:hypothetical protein
MTRKLCAFYAEAGNSDSMPPGKYYMAEDVNGYLVQRTALAMCLRAILYHDERGQGIGYAEAMAHAVKLLAAMDAEEQKP